MSRAAEGPDGDLVRCLADGRYHSGETLGALLGVSRAAVWKRLQKLAVFGLDVESVRGKGYRLPGGLNLLDAEGLRAAMAAAGGNPQALSLHLLDATDSTNADALALSREGLRQPLAVLAEYQRAGRGRRGRAWQSPYGRNLYLSYAESFSGGAAALDGLSLVVGVVVADVLAGAGLAERVQLKWPNDIWVGGRKLGGILVELAGDMDGVCVPVIGIGINGHLSAAAAGAIDQPWTDLARELGGAPDRSGLAGALLAGLQRALATFRQQGFAPFRAAWQQYDCCAGEYVTVQLGERRITGRACGVTAQGALLVDVEGTLQQFHGGEVSVRPLPSE
ncbi:bifunctional biotin--[acetyl-CoA-carboxylase] ligase/biotin operon repressor BirA [Isoalcanivorax indicus]|uniref:bifunctional biotin--[acetyl-CoA-carboxylase] ligase/biotin operon repressor BirA n=1 Tax=Isoalcanivorax indicus TaxID=2202653 RepID=UPI000DB99A87|nr:bifunctional biotin--[acetyl-CoA-carboxylase] ligase/biotin operon repressor BirA [Isoalcanivorax indicus]